ncbi:MAG: hypothetical protein LBR95_06540 [Azoarcus sp.]|jgi:hypothetical protein|nr:hypothetical protein [Azoarcus sp.]
MRQEKNEILIFAPGRTPEIERMVSAAQAAYAWDGKNPFVVKSERRLASVQAACALA